MMPYPNLSNLYETEPVAENLPNSAIALLSGPYAQAVITVWNKTSIAEYLVASDARRHAWHCWLAMHRDSGFDPADAYQLLTFSKTTTVLADAFGECPSGLPAALKRLGPFARSSFSYGSLYRIFLKGGPLAQHLSSQLQVSDGDIRAVAAAQVITISDRIIRALLKCQIPVSAVQQLLWISSRLIDAYSEDQIFRSIRRSSNPETIVGDLFGLQPFPAPPFVPAKEIMPITSADQLSEAGKKFENCLRHRDEFARALLSIHSGHRYYYQLHGDFPALMAFSKCGNAGWVLTEQAGPTNLRLPPETQALITELLADVPSVHANGSGPGLLGWMATG